ncbi:MAG: DUF3450 family protein [Gammaproteobacteria bacterium]|nr:DUF3450 family protein [Gammaproteobacteria bacterium]
MHRISLCRRNFRKGAFVMLYGFWLVACQVGNSEPVLYQSDVDRQIALIQQDFAKLTEQTFIAKEAWTIITRLDEQVQRDLPIRYELRQAQLDKIRAMIWRSQKQYSDQKLPVPEQFNSAIYQRIVEFINSEVTLGRSINQDTSDFYADGQEYSAKRMHFGRLALVLLVPERKLGQCFHPQQQQWVAVSSEMLAELTQAIRVPSQISRANLPAGFPCTPG